MHSQRDHHPAADRQTTSGQAGTGPARQEGNIQLVADLDDLHDLFGRGGEDNHVRPVLLDGVTVALVDNEIAGRGEQAVASHNGAQAVDQGRGEGGHREWLRVTDSFDPGSQGAGQISNI